MSDLADRIEARCAEHDTHECLLGPDPYGTSFKAVWQQMRRDIDLLREAAAALREAEGRLAEIASAETSMSRDTALGLIEDAKRWGMAYVRERDRLTEIADILEPVHDLRIADRSDPSGSLTLRLAIRAALNIAREGK